MEEMKPLSTLHYRIMQLQATMNSPAAAPKPDVLPSVQPVGGVPMSYPPPEEEFALQHEQNTEMGKDRSIKPSTPSNRTGKSATDVGKPVEKHATKNRHQQLLDKINRLEAALLQAQNQNATNERLATQHAQRALFAEKDVLQMKRETLTRTSELKGQGVHRQRLEKETKRLQAALKKDKSTRETKMRQCQIALDQTERRARHLEKENAQLRAALQKQGELLQVLDRQVEHAQAMQLLSIMEEDFDNLVADLRRSGRE